MVLVDGVPLALAPYTGTGLSLFPVTSETVERIDLVRGSVAVRYGPNNVGGVIELITQPIPRQRSATVKQQLTIAGSTGHTFSDTYARFETDAFAGYVSDTLAFFNGRVEVTPGVRYERVDTDFRNKQNGATSSTARSNSTAACCCFATSVRRATRASIWRRAVSRATACGDWCRRCAAGPAGSPGCRPPTRRAGRAARAEPRSAGAGMGRGTGRAGRQGRRGCTRSA